MLNIFFFVVSICLAGTAGEIQEIRQVDASGYEVIIHGPRLTNDETYGYIAVPNSTHEIIKLKNGREVYRTQATIDENGFRKSSASHLHGKTKHLLLVDSSMVFGEGLAETETLFHLINTRSRDFEAYPVAFYGYGPQQAWLRFQQKKLPLQVKEKSGRLLFFTHEGDLQRMFGSMSKLNYIAAFPHLEKDASGHFQFLGNFANSGTWWQKFILNYCLPFHFCADWTTRFDGEELTPGQYVAAGSLLNEIGQMYHDQFAAEDLTVVWLGRESNAAKLQSGTKFKIVNFLGKESDAHADGHRTPEGIKRLADFLFEKKLIY